MQGKVHVAIGTASLALFCFRYPTGFQIGNAIVLPELALFFAAAGSYAPDIDLQTTHAGRKHKVTSKVVSKVGGGHRGVTHSLIIPILALAIMINLGNVVGNYKLISMLLISPIFGFLYGYIAHIIADMFNGKGCPILWPVSSSKISFMDLPSSGIVPWVFTVVVTVVQALPILGGVFNAVR